MMNNAKLVIMTVDERADIFLFQIMFVKLILKIIHKRFWVRVNIEVNFAYIKF